MTMHRELNPQLFGSSTPVEKIGNPVDPHHPATGIMGRGEQAASSQAAYAPIEVKSLEHQLNMSKVTLMQLEKRTDGLTAKAEEISRNTHTRFERFAQAVLRIEETQARIHQENTAKIAHLAARVNESKITDTKVQELMDRHNQIIRNFENRLLSLQRLVSEQEMTLHNAQAALEEARNEITRLKRN
jgi:chromosome segregation ATPase